MKLQVSRLQERGQVTIPREIREKLGLEPGDMIAFVETEHGIVLDETVRNLASKRPDALASLRVTVDAIPLQVSNPTREEVLAMQPYTAIKDAPHFATAVKAKAYSVVSVILLIMGPSLLHII